MTANVLQALLQWSPAAAAGLLAIALALRWMAGRPQQVALRRRVTGISRKGSR